MAGWRDEHPYERLDLDGADLSGADLRNASLSPAWLRDANLSGAKLEGVELIGSLLNRVDLTGANLRRAQATRNLREVAREARKLSGEPEFRLRRHAPQIGHKQQPAASVSR